MADNGKDAATKADLLAVERRLDQKIDSSVERLDQKIDSSVDRLDRKIDFSVQRLAKAIVETQAEVREMKAVMATKDDVNRILNAIDAFAGKAKHYDRAAVLHGHALTEVGAKVKDHEKRIQALESARR